jgi:hypothetical protein
VADWRELDWGEAPTSSSTNDLIFSGATLGKNPNNGSSGFLVGSITFAADAGAFTLVNLPFILNGNLTNNCSTNAEAFYLNWSLSSGNHIFSVVSAGNLEQLGVPFPAVAM